MVEVREMDRERRREGGERQRGRERESGCVTEMERECV
eukprot:jgi/Botrbrau1/16197/Bobra.354_1s0004.1